MSSPSFKRWLYRGNRQNFLARVINRFWAIVHATGIAPNYLVTLEIKGRKTGRAISFPLAMTVIGDERYLVAMLGEGASWVRNLRAADGCAVLRHGRIECVRLIEVPVDQRSPILKAYLQIAPGARPHIPINKDAPVEAFDAIATQIPVFRVMEASD